MLIDTQNISDGYHTFKELYQHRNLLFINICVAMAKAMPELTWWNVGHYDGYFCLYLLTDVGQISYHIEMEYLPIIKDLIRKALPDVDVFDGHTSGDVVERLRRLCVVQSS